MTETPTGPGRGYAGPPGAYGRLGDRYEIGGVLGSGGMAEVRIGRDLRLGRTVAIKRLRIDLASEPTFLARFRREAQSAAALNHPSIVAVYDTGEATGPDGHTVPFIVMEYVEGKTLRDLLREMEREGRKILPERALEIIPEGDGVSVCTDQGVHRADRAYGGETYPLRGHERGQRLDNRLAALDADDVAVGVGPRLLEAHFLLLQRFDLEFVGARRCRFYAAWVYVCTPAVYLWLHVPQEVGYGQRRPESCQHRRRSEKQERQHHAPQDRMALYGPLLGLKLL